jgi:hypothetical protein
VTVARTGVAGDDPVPDTSAEDLLGAGADHPGDRSTHVDQLVAGVAEAAVDRPATPLLD